MITKISTYYLTQPIIETENLVEFTEEEYANFQIAGTKRTLNEEKFFHAPDIDFLGGNWDLIIGSTNGVIYKLSAQNLVNDKRLSDDIFNKTLKELIKVMGKYNEHPFLSKQYIWDDNEGNVILNQVSRSGFIAINFLITSSIIRKQPQNLHI